MTLSWVAVAPIAIAVPGLSRRRRVCRSALYFRAVFPDGIAASVFKPMPRHAFSVINVAPVAGLSNHFF